MQLPRWKKEQKKRKSRKTQYAIRKTLLVILAILLVGIGWKVYVSFRKSIWDGKSRLTLALNSTPILVASFDLSDKTLNFLSIPGSTHIEVIHGYGFYKTESIWRLGELENYGGELLAGSLQEYLGVPVDAYASISNSSLCEISSKCKYQISNIKPKEGFLSIIRSLMEGNGQTNLSKWDLFRLWWGIRGVRFDKIKLVDLGETNAVKEIALPDGTHALESDPLRLDQLVLRFFSDQKIKNEGLSIGIYNSTEHPALAKKAARIINNIGGQVIEVGDWDEKYQISNIKYQKSNVKKYTTRKLMKIFDCQYGGSDLGESRAELVIIIGENYWQKLMEK